MDRTGCSGRTEQGFILIVVIWLLALFALVSAGVVRSVQAHVRATGHHTQARRAELLADSGLNLAVLDLLETRARAGRTRRFPIDGAAVVCAVAGDGQLAIRVQDDGGRVNLNSAGERLLQALFLGLGATREQASRYTDSIIDFRDADDVRRPAGAEKPEYAAAGLPFGPKNAPFDATEELHQVLGLDPAIIGAMRPHVTIHSGTAGLDPRAASPELVALLARGLADLPGRAPDTTADARLPAEFVVGSSQRIFWITATAYHTGGAIYVREALVELPQNRDGVPTFKAWRRGELQIAQGERAGAGGPC